MRCYSFIYRLLASSVIEAHINQASADLLVLYKDLSSFCFNFNKFLVWSDHNNNNDYNNNKATHGPDYRNDTFSPI